MFETIKKPKNTQLVFYLLKVLNEKYACANEIKQKLESRHINYQRKDFFPVLSHLVLNNYLCYNWISKSGKLEKYFHLTKNGSIHLKELVVI